MGISSSVPRSFRKSSTIAITPPGSILDLGPTTGPTRKLTDRNRQDVVAAEHVDLHPAARLQRRGELFHGADAPRVDPDDEVAGAQAVAVRRRLGLDRGHQHRAVGPGKARLADFAEHRAGELLHRFATARGALDRADLRLEGALFAAALHLQLDRVAHGHDAEPRSQLGGAAHRPAVEARDHVALAHAGLRGGRVGLDLGDGRALASDHVGHAYPEAPALHLAELDDLLEDRMRHHHRDREADADVAAGGPDDRGVDADELALE